MKRWGVLSCWIIFISFARLPLAFGYSVSWAMEEPLDQIDFDEGQLFLAVGDGNVWVWNRDQQMIEAYNLAAGQPTDIAISLPFEAFAASVEAGSLWILSSDRTQVAGINLTTYELNGTVDISAYYEPWEYVTIVTGEGTVWIKGEETVLQIDPQTHEIIGEPIPAGEEILFATIANGELWIGSHDDGLITRLDIQTQQINAQFDLGFSVHGLAVTDTAAWVLDEHGFGVVQVDLQTNGVTARIPIDFVAANLAALNDEVWVAPAAYDGGSATDNDSFLCIDAENSQVMETVPVGGIQSSEAGYYLGLVEDGEAWAVIFDDPITRLVRLPETCQHEQVTTMPLSAVK